MDFGILKCILLLRHVVTIPDEIAEFATKNPDKDYEVACDRCGSLAYAYFSKKHNEVRIYDAEAVFGDAYRE